MELVSRATAVPPAMYSISVAVGLMLTIRIWLGRNLDTPTEHINYFQRISLQCMSSGADVSVRE